MKRVLLISNYVFHYRQKVYNYFADRFLKDGFEFHVLSNEFQDAGYTYRFIAHTLPMTVPGYKKMIDELNPAVVIVFLHLKDKIELPIIHYCKRKHIPVIFWNKGVSDTDPNNVIKNMIYHHIHNTCDALITYTPEMIDNFKQKNRKKLFVAYNTVDCSDIDKSRYDREAIKQAVLSVKDQADFIVVCSGSSAGREDYTSSIVEELGELIVHGIATRPGKPAILGIIDNKPLIGVPGYPISAQLVFSLFAKPVLLKKQAIDLPEPETITAQMSRKIASSMGVDEFINVNLAYMEGKYLAYPLNRGAGITTSLVKADGITVIPRGKEGINAGEDCQIKLWRPRKVLDETLVCIGSHDMSIDILADLLYKSYGLRLISSNVGSMGGLMALRRGETHFSGIHLLDYETGKYNTSYVNRYLPGQDWCLINLVNRQQGLIVKKGNPLNVQSLQDITRDNIRYINRQKGSGTRLLLDFMLQQQGVDSNSIYGYNREEYTHLAVAAAVKNDAGDVALGIYSSARALDLDFVPLAEESYDLCILPERLGDIRLEQLLSVIQSNEFKKHIDQIGGYNLKSSGQITSQSR